MARPVTGVEKRRRAKAKKDREARRKRDAKAKSAREAKPLTGREKLYGRATASSGFPEKRFSAARRNMPRGPAAAQPRGQRPGAPPPAREAVPVPPPSPTAAPKDLYTPRPAARTPRELINRPRRETFLQSSEAVGANRSPQERFTGPPPAGGVRPGMGMDRRGATMGPAGSPPGGAGRGADLMRARPAGGHQGRMQAMERARREAAQGHLGTAPPIDPRVGQSMQARMERARQAAAARRSTPRSQSDFRRGWRPWLNR